MVRVTSPILYFDAHNHISATAEVKSCQSTWVPCVVVVVHSVARIQTIARARLPTKELFQIIMNREIILGRKKRV